MFVHNYLFKLDNIDRNYFDEKFFSIKFQLSRVI